MPRSVPEPLPARDDVAGQQLAPVPGLSSTTGAGLARRFTDGQWHAVETGIGDIGGAMLAALPAQRAAALCAEVTIDLDTTDVEVYGRHKRGVAFNHQGQRCGRPHVATWAQRATVLAGDLMAGNEDPRPHAAELLGRALAALPAPARAGKIRLRADAGYFAGQLTRAALFAGVEFAIGASLHSADGDVNEFRYGATIGRDVDARQYTQRRSGERVSQLG